MATRSAMSDSVHHTTANYVEQRFQQWWISEANPAYKKLLALEQDVSKLKEPIEVLNGTRNRQSLSKSAVTFSDLSALRGVSSSTKANKVPANSTVSAAAYNALVDDVSELKRIIGQISNIVDYKLR